jgi:hypothetical protein
MRHRVAVRSGEPAVAGWLLRDNGGRAQSYTRPRRPTSPFEFGRSWRSWRAPVIGQPFQSRGSVNGAFIARGLGSRGAGLRFSQRFNTTTARVFPASWRSWWWWCSAASQCATCATSQGECCTTPTVLTIIWWSRWPPSGLSTVRAVQSTGGADGCPQDFTRGERCSPLVEQTDALSGVYQVYGERRLWTCTLSRAVRLYV